MWTLLSKKVWINTGCIWMQAIAMRTIMKLCHTPALSNEEIKIK